MMLYPPVSELVDEVGSRYQLVNLVAKRARDISAEEELADVKSDEKAVSLAINEVYTKKLRLIRSEENQEED